MGLTISDQDRRNLRESSAYGRMLWGLRLAAIGGALFVSSIGLLALGLKGSILFAIIATALAAGWLGIFLSWGAIIPLTRQQRATLTRYGMSSLERAAFIRKMVLRDAFKGRVSSQH